MKSLQPLCAALLLFITCSAFAADPTLPELFKRAKDKFAARRLQRLARRLRAARRQQRQAGIRSRSRQADSGGHVLSRREPRRARPQERREGSVHHLPRLRADCRDRVAAVSDRRPSISSNGAQRSGRPFERPSRTAYARSLTPAGWSLPADEHWIESPVSIS